MSLGSLRPILNIALCLGLQLPVVLTALFSELLVASPSFAQAADKKYEVLVVLVYTDTCKVACTRVRPVMQELSVKYGEKVKYIELNGSTLDEASKTAATFGVRTFLEDSTDLAPIVGIFNPKGKRLKELQGYKDKEVYQAAIDKALGK